MHKLPPPRLIGMPMHPDHFAQIRTLHADPRVMATLSTDGNIFTDDQTRAFLQRAAEHWTLHNFGLWIFHMIDTTHFVFVGYAGIKHAAVEDKDEIELAYAVSSAHRNKGFATEMSNAALKFGFDDLHLERILAFTLPHNKPSRTVMEHCGFIYQRNIIHASRSHVLYHLDSSTYASRAKLKSS